MNNPNNGGSTAKVERLQVEAMISEGGSAAPTAVSGEANDEAAPDSSRRRKREFRPPAGPIAKLKGRVKEKVSSMIDDFGRRNFERLNRARDRGATGLLTIPDRMHRVANQTKLILELFDDFRAGRYRDIPWRSIAVLAGAALYAVSPADIVPDVLPGLGSLDDLTVVAAATRWAQKDLKRYCEFKGYPISEYFA